MADQERCPSCRTLGMTRMILCSSVDGGPSFPMMLTVDTLIGQLVRMGWAE